VDILLDRQPGAAGVSEKSEISIAVENQPLADALDDLLATLKLGYRAIDAIRSGINAIGPSCPVVLEFYQVSKLLDKDFSGWT